MRALYDEHAQPLWHFALRLTSGDRPRAEDIVQETLLRAWRQPAILAQGEGIRSWLFTVARRVLIDDWRSARARHEIVTDLPPDVSTPDRTEHVDTRAVVVTALQRLKAEHREVLLEAHVRGSTVSETARKLGIPEGTAKSRTHYALRAFKLAVEEMGGVS